MPSSSTKFQYPALGSSATEKSSKCPALAKFQHFGGGGNLQLKNHKLSTSSSKCVTFLLGGGHLQLKNLQSAGDLPKFHLSGDWDVSWSTEKSIVSMASSGLKFHFRGRYFPDWKIIKVPRSA